MSAVSLNNIEKSYQNTHNIINGIDLEIQDGEFLVLVGPSGCGKSTLLRMIAGLENISAGDLSIGGHRSNELAPSDRGVAMVFQSYALYPHMTVAENLGFGLKMGGMPARDIEVSVNQAARKLQIDHLLESKPKALSGGQRQRVAIGRAIVRNPKVFLFDEPLSNLDAELRVQMRVELSRLHRQLGTTMIYVTHDQTEAMTLGDRIVVLNGGGIEQVGTPMELYNTPINRFVGGFIGSPKMNFIPVTQVEAGISSTKIYINDHVFVMPWYVKGNVSSKSKPKDSTGYELGIRPEHLGLSKESGLEARVDVLEQLGDSTLVHATLEVNDTRVIAKIQGQLPNLNIGDSIRLTPDFDCVHLLNKEGRNIRQFT